MSHYNNQEIDFINRTKEIIRQYNDFRIVEKEKYKDTLFLNCLVGLLILPQQYWFDSFPTELVSQKEWGINPSHISSIKDGETKKIKDIARHLRNSIAHYEFKAFDNASSQISSINFKDKDRVGNVTFEATIPLHSLRQFVTKLTETLITEMDKQK
ncbi:hypothetical protein EZS27_021044 [termite gut metagenome]|uniref:pEK499-p136 HEPN domain-containing protein n=1 Tax=termite gut metagenome TaxID=433724 RepID=A0A5J4R907_9ZZZZ